jgi:signal peptidase I
MRALSFLLLVGLLAGGWWVVAPPALGGRTSIVVVDGSSMNPRLAPSDVVALRSASSYGVGDVVAYRSKLLGRLVLHRIVAIRDGRYVFKGDNNSFLDPDRPRRAELIGKLWVRIPSGGRIAAAAHQPVVLASLAALLVLVAFPGARRA